MLIQGGKIILSAPITLKEFLLEVGNVKEYQDYQIIWREEVKAVERLFNSLRPVQTES